jgi:predicted phosphodiesterase
MAYKALVVSDIHLGTHLTRFDRIREHLIAHIKMHDYVVWNGDIIDTMLCDHNARPEMVLLGKVDALKRANSIIEKHFRPILRLCPNAMNMHINGNHESGDTIKSEFLYEPFESLAKEERNYFWYPEECLLGDALFVHGERYIPLHLHRKASREEICDYVLKGVERSFDVSTYSKVFFGHTHDGFEGLVLKASNGKEISFYNTGSIHNEAKSHAFSLTIEKDIITEVKMVDIEREPDRTSFQSR